MRLLLVLLLLAGCGDDDVRMPSDAGPDLGLVDGGADAPAPADAAPEDASDAGVCNCGFGSHSTRVYMMSQDAEIWSFDPATLEAAFVAGPVCDGDPPFSMAVDSDGIAWILSARSLSLRRVDVNDPGPCASSPYVRRNPDFGLFGMSFASRSASDFCSDLMVMTYDGEGPFEEGPGLGQIGRIDPESGDLTPVAPVDFDGGELTGTGDGRLFALAGTDPVKLVEYDRTTGALIETIPLDGFNKTNASALAFFAGDLYLFIEASPAGCEDCLQSTCPALVADCRADETCASHLQCMIDTAMFTDECGGEMPPELQDCVTRDCAICGLRPRERVSRVLRYDLDGDRSLVEVVEGLPIRVVGAAASPCVPTAPI